MKSGPLKSSGLLCAALICLASAALAQDAAADAQNAPKRTSQIKGDVSDELPDLVELDPFGGISLFGQINRGLGEKLINGGSAGGRVAFNMTRYLGLELSYNFSGNNVRLVQPIAPGLPSYDFGQQSHAVSLDPVFNFRPRGSRIQPYVTAGVGFINFVPTKQAIDFATNPANNAIYHTANLRNDLEVAFNYGGGVKFHVSPHFGLRFDLRGLILPKNPTFGLPSFPTGGEYIVGKNLLSGLDATVGLVFYFGSHSVPVAAAPVVPVGPLSAGEITGAGGTLCQGKPVTLHATTSDPANHTLKYTWKLNGAPQSAEGPDFSFTPNNAGDNSVEVTVVDTADATRVITAGPRIISVQDYTPPQIASVTATPSTLSCSADTNGVHSATLAGAATGSACGGNLSYKWTVSEGSVSNDTNASATFDASNLSFESGGQSQTKTITATLTVTDEAGKSANAPATITVNCPPQFKRLPDVVFAKNSPRVNNCGKRILIDQAAQQAGSAYDVLLVAHRSSDEKETLGVAKKGRRAAAPRTLDEQRALNAAAVLMNGTKTCGTVDPSQIKIDVEGLDQTSTPDPGLCGTSNLPSEKERKGSAVTDIDKERRVEVYLVPKGSQAMPPAAKNSKAVPEPAVKAIGCPR
jgi:opacity protein-like surface antigen